ncbi:MAG: hypothetical protein ABR591_03940 [Candidatus Velthaea sp.]
MNAKFITTGALALAISAGSVAPALADGAASTRNIILGGAAAAVLVTNYNHKKRIKRQEDQQAQRRQARANARYRAAYYRAHGHYPG